MRMECIENNQDHKRFSKNYLGPFCRFSFGNINEYQCGTVMIRCQRECITRELGYILLAIIWTYNRYTYTVYAQCTHSHIICIYITLYLQLNVQSVGYSTLDLRGSLKCREGLIRLMCRGLMSPGDL